MNLSTRMTGHTSLTIFSRCNTYKKLQYSRQIMLNCLIYTCAQSAHHFFWVHIAKLHIGREKYWWT